MDVRVHALFLFYSHADNKWKSLNPKLATSKKNTGPPNAYEKKKLDPWNIHQKKLWTHDMRRKNFGPASQKSIFSELLLGWHDVATSINVQINVETTLCFSTLKFTKLSNVESTLSISKLIWTTLDNVGITLLFSSTSFTTLINVETTLWIWPFTKSWKEQSKKCFWA